MNHFSKHRAGEVILISYPFTNLQGNKVRPALVVRPQKDEDLLLAPISTTVQRTRNDYLIKEQDYEESPLPVLSCLRYEKLFTLSSELVLKKVTRLKKQIFTKVRQKILDFIAEV